MGGFCSCPHATSHLVQVNCHLVGLHLHLLHQLLPLQLEGHSSGWATAAQWVPPTRASTPRGCAGGAEGVPGAAGASHLHHGALVRDVAGWQLGLDDNHVGGGTVPSVPARTEPQGWELPSLLDCPQPHQTQGATPAPTVPGGGGGNGCWRPPDTPWGLSPRGGRTSLCSEGVAC